MTARPAPAGRRAQAGGRRAGRRRGRAVDFGDRARAAWCPGLAAALLAGTAVAGAGSGTGFFRGAYRILTPLAGPGQRASLIAATWLGFDLPFSVPVVIAGAAITHFRDERDVDG